MPNARRYRVKIGEVVICSFVRENDNAQVMINVWSDKSPFTGTNEQIIYIAQTMLPVECRHLVTVVEVE